ncbi:hypothetical protein [Haloarcula laminariae]|uniref:hypothetical protein n=1 Tax=Haloarcula laminariae TaxID=2961577 RepID=UPI0021C6991A|nr:hypothetical protein [Halomicroarcula laminariae]
MGADLSDFTSEETQVYYEREFEGHSITVTDTEDGIKTVVSTEHSSISLDGSDVLELDYSVSKACDVVVDKQQSRLDGWS